MLIRKLGIIGRTYYHVQRYRQILAVLFKYGFDDIVTRLNIDQYVEIGLKVISRKKPEKIASLSTGERVRMALQELGPTFIKMGQILSTRADMLPQELVNELPKLQDEIPPFPFEDVKKIFESQLNAPLEEIFTSFDEKPISAASIGQVHKAELKYGNGEEVAVKIQRPDIWRTIETDIEIMYHLASLMEKHIEGWDVHKPTQIVEEFGNTIEKELDYTIEASHMELFAKYFADEPSIYVPKVYRDATTTRILTMEYVNGIKPDKIERLEDEGMDLKILAERHADLILKQIFNNGLLHIDPHPGNMRILQNNVICYLDYGMVMRIDRDTKEAFTDMIVGIVDNDDKKIADSLVNLALPSEEVDLKMLRRDITEFMDQHLHKPLKELEFGKLMQHLMWKASKHKLQIRPNLFLLLKALSMAESLGRKLDPDFDIVQHARPFIKNVQIDRYKPGRITSDLLGSASDIIRLLKVIPNDVREILKLAKRGMLKIDIKHQGFEDILSVLDRVGNRLTFAVILASIVVGSSLIIHSGIPPTIYEIPIIGLLGFIFAGVLGLWILISMIRSGLMK